MYSNLLSIYSQHFDHALVEIIISDNFSTDDTSAVVNNFLSYDNLQYYRQEFNIGMSANFIKVVNVYASGEYCWIIGDDDFPLPGSINALIELLKLNKEIDFFYLKLGHMFIDEYNKYDGKFNTSLLDNKVVFSKLKCHKIEKWEELISPDYSIVFLGEIQGSVFRRKIWQQFKDIDLEGAPLEKLETTYPHAVVFANTFIGKRAMYIETPLIIVLNGIREWWHKVDYVIIVQVRNLLKLYKSKGIDKGILNKCYKLYIDMSFPSIKRYISGETTVHRNKVSFFSYFIYCFLNSPEYFMKTLKKEVKINLARTLLYRKLKGHSKMNKSLVI